MLGVEEKFLSNSNGVVKFVTQNLHLSCYVCSILDLCSYVFHVFNGITCLTHKHKPFFPVSSSVALYVVFYPTHDIYGRLSSITRLGLFHRFFVS